MADKTETRLLLLYSDGSMGVLRPDQTAADAETEAEDSDYRETDPAMMTRVFRVHIDFLEEIARKGHLNTRPRKGACPHCGADKAASTRVA